MKNFLTLIFLILFAISSIAQTKNYSIKEATLGLATNLAQESMKQTSWRPKSSDFFFISNDKLVRMNVKSGAVDTFLKADDIKNNEGRTAELKKISGIQWTEDGAIYLQTGDMVTVANSPELKSWTFFKMEPEASDVYMNPQGKMVAYVSNNNIFLNKNGENIQVTTDGDYNFVNGKSVHREEFGIDHGLFWSPKGNLLAYYKMDQSEVMDYPIINWNAEPAQNKNIKYPMAGGPSHHVTLHVYDPETRADTEIETRDPFDQYLTAVTWSPDEQSVFIALLNRDQNHLWLNQYDAKTGRKIKTLFEETDPKYVHPEHGLSFIPGKENEFLWYSDRDGYRHLYHYNTSGKLIKQLTKGDWEVNEILGFDEKNVLITSSKESPLEKHIYSVNLSSGKMNRIDKEAGTHNAVLSGDGKYIYDTYSSDDQPRVSRIINTEGKLIRELIRSKDPLSEFNRPEIKNVLLKAKDGTPLYGKIILPTGFDAAKKYPVIVYLYNGPNVQLLHNSYPASGNLWYEYMAQKGYIVFTMDGRGSANRGMKFEQATFRDLGTVELEDQLQGVAYLHGLPYVDKERMGIHGWSYGGFMTTSMMLRHPDVFKVGVAGGPVMDWSMYEVMYTERYMDTPETNPEGYERSNLLTKVKDLKGKLLLIHGTDDNVVVWQHSLRFLKKAVDEGVQLDYFVYPGYEHNVRGKDRVHLMQKVTDYFDLYLKK